MTPTVGQEVTPTTDVDLAGETYLVVRLASDGSRRVIDRAGAETGTLRPTWALIRDFWIERWEGDPIVFWGLNSGPMSNALHYAGINGWYLPYPPADGIAVVPTEASG